MSEEQGSAIERSRAAALKCAQLRKALQRARRELAETRRARAADTGRDARSRPGGAEELAVAAVDSAAAELAAAAAKAQRLKVAARLARG